VHDAGRALMDAEEEDEKAWLTQYASDALDEFDDVSWEEKELMKMWNAFTRSYSIWSDAYVARGCTIFAVRHARELAAKKLRQNFLLHLVCLWERGLVTGEHIVECLAAVDAVAA